MKKDPKDIYGISEIARVAKVSQSCITNWTTRYEHFPKPWIKLSMGPIFRGPEVRRWLKLHKGIEVQ